LNLGAAFQLVDDLLDFTATHDILGKPAGVDLLEGKLTLPLIYLLEVAPKQRAAVQSIMRNGSYETTPRAVLIDAAERTGALARARARASEYAEAARTALDHLPDSPYRTALRSIPNYILERES
jgi:octaprenyl-diphosphate synthase